MLKRFSGELLIGLSIVVALAGAALSTYRSLGIGLTMLACAVLAAAGLSLTLRRRLQGKLAHSDNPAANLQWYAEELTRREQELDNRLLVFHEWMEFPTPPTAQPQRTDDDWLEISQRDQRLLEFLEEESRRIFDKIQANEYSIDGQVQLDAIRKEALRLFTSVAQIYRPDLAEPLLETSAEKILRAASRTCLQLLVLTEQLPLDVKSYNLRKLHAYIQNAVKAYGMYRSVEPYWPMLNRAYYLGRVALGASPVSLGAWWVMSNLGTRGAKELASQLVNQQAMRLLQDLVRVVGFEVASLYSEDFRYRDANWIYAALLTDLVAQRDLDTQTLHKVMVELGTLPLRSEYDRVFLYRCVATQQSPPTGETPLARILEPAERRAVCRRLHAFSQQLTKGKEELPAAWKQQVESWLDVRWPDRQLMAESEVDQVIAGLRSLTGFLHEFKNQDADAAVERIQETQLMRRLPATTQQELSQQLRDEPPYFFEQPMLDIDSELATQFCDDLVELAVNCLPYDGSEEELFRQVAAYLHVDEKELVKKLNDETLERLAREHSQLDLSPAPPARVARTILELIPSQGDVIGLFSGAYSEGPDGKVDRDLWIVATTNQLIAVRAEGPMSVAWCSDDTSTIDVQSAWSGNFATIRGGRWSEDRDGRPANVPMPDRIIVPAGILQRNDSFFDPLRRSLR